MDFVGSQERFLVPDNSDPVSYQISLVLPSSKRLHEAKPKTSLDFRQVLER